MFFTTGRTEAQIGLEYDIVKGQVRTSQGGQVVQVVQVVKRQVSEN